MRKNSVKRIAIQGFEGCFHQEAAQKFYGKDVEVICCSTFRDLIQISQNVSESDGGIMAIENSIAGSILPNYNLLQKSNLQIIGEAYLHIRQNLIVNKDVSMEDIKEVHSHPMALQQCLTFLDQYNWKLVETEDTALSAKHVKQRHSKHIAAIASNLAAEIYDLKIIQPDIHTLKNNYTRFLALTPKSDEIVIENANKASIIFHTDHSKGSLAKVLTIIATAGINLSKLQSMPIQGSDFKYLFYADLEFTNTSDFFGTLKDIEVCTEALQVLGTYIDGRK